MVADVRDTDLSLEFLMGRALDNAMLNVGLKDVARGQYQSILITLVVLILDSWSGRPRFPN